MYIFLKIIFQMLLLGDEKPLGLIIRSSFLFVIVYIFSELWSTTDLTGTVLTRNTMIWYLCTTEVIVLSLPLIHFEIESDIRSGDIVYLLNRPISYLWIRAAEAISTLIFRFTVLSVAAYIFATFLCDGWTPPIYNVFSGIIIAFLASIALLFFQIAIGLTAFRIEDCSSLFWLWQRSSFLLGGLIIPLDLYPNFLRTISKYTPFPALIYGPAKIVSAVVYIKSVGVLFPILAWLVVAILLCHYQYTAAFRQIRINGG